MEPDVQDCQGQPVTVEPAVYPAFYHGPVQYWALLAVEKVILLDQFEHYTKQTYRNRCRIAGPNGVINLSIPVKKRRGRKNRIRDIRIDYDTPWNKIHWRSLVASYASSPFFEFFRDELSPFYEERYQFLFDLNEKLLRTTLRWLGLNIPVRLTESYMELPEEDDLRLRIHPKQDPLVTHPLFRPVEYHQVFSDRFGFQQNLNILDLLFNTGPSARTLLKGCLRT